MQTSLDGKSSAGMESIQYKRNYSASLICWNICCIPTVKQVKDITAIKEVLNTAFTVDSFVAHEQFTASCLHPGESVGVCFGRITQIVSI